MRYSLRTVLTFVAILSIWLAWRGNRLRDVNMPELLDNCRTSLRYSCRGEGLVGEVVDLKVLAMYRMRDDRPLHVDYALCGAKISSDENEFFALVKMARNPFSTRNHRKTWSAAVNTGSNDSMHFFDNKPTVQDVDTKMRFLKESDDWDVYTKRLFRRNWAEFVTGKLPERLTK